MPSTTAASRPAAIEEIARNGKRGKTAAVQKPARKVCQIHVGQTLAAATYHYIIATLCYCEHNESEAARMLGIERNTLRSRLAKIGRAG